MPPNDFDASRDLQALTVSFETGTRVASQRALPVEMPINIVYAPMPFAVMMATPEDLEDFAIGFSLTEGIIDRCDEIRDIEIEHSEKGLRLLISLSSDKMQRHLARSRAISGRTGCGLCGIDDLDALPRAKSPVIRGEVQLAAIKSGLDALELHQPLNERTRAVHAAAWADLSGTIVCVREDVGRHNALDKLIGALARRNADPAEGFFLITSRCSFEMVEKAALFGAHTIVAISAPTSLAVERAELHGMALVALARRDSAMVFTSPERILGVDPVSESPLS
jgi:FdhD protein